MSGKDYTNPLSTRYASEEMLAIFTSDKKYQLWRKLWQALAEAQKSLGLKITDQQLAELKKHETPIDYEAVHKYESLLRHDVMAHIHAYGEVCPKAKGVIHLGATSCFVTDNGDLIQYKDALKVLFSKLLTILDEFSHLASKHAGLLCLGYTHLQVAQPTTVGKRICLWLQNFLWDALAVERLIHNLPFLGIKGATGTQASLITLFHGDQSKVEACDQYIASKFGFSHCLKVVGQTYPRKIDLQITQLLTQIAVSANKFATDIRLLSHTGEFSEKSEKKQVGSSAMPYKKNPIHSERICSLSRFVKNLGHNAEDTAAHQWLERSLDDSANRRLALPEAFLATDAILKHLNHLVNHLEINTKVLDSKLQNAIPFLATENILMKGVEKGASRQVLHEQLRQVCLEAKQVPDPLQGNHLIQLILKIPNFPLSKRELEAIIKTSQYEGSATSQVELFIKEELAPFLNKHRHLQSKISPVNL